MTKAMQNLVDIIGNKLQANSKNILKPKQNNRKNKLLKLVSLPCLKVKKEDLDDKVGCLKEDDLQLITFFP